MNTKPEIHGYVKNVGSAHVAASVQTIKINMENFK
jgi:hypothetical protein